MRQKVMAAVVGVLAIWSVVVLSLTASRPSGGEEVSSLSSVQSQTAVHYVVRAYEGKLAVYLYDESLPKQILDVDISRLPEEDRNRLENGIDVYSDEVLYSLIEDYDS